MITYILLLYKDELESKRLLQDRNQLILSSCVHLLKDFEALDLCVLLSLNGNRRLPQVSGKEMTLLFLGLASRF